MLGSQFTRLVRAVSFCALLATAALWAPPASAAEEGNYIVVFEESVERPGEVAQAQVERRDGKLGFVYRHALEGYSATLPKDEVEAIRRDPRVNYVVLDSKRITSDVQTNPTGVKRIFASTNSLLDIDEVDDERADVDVAVLDSGIAKHEDLNVFASASCVPPKKFEEPEVKKCVEGEVKDESSHGTHVAGTIAAIDNNKGVVGVAPGARLWAVKVMTLTAGGKDSYEEAWVVAAIDWVTANAEEIEVANMSFGCTEFPGGLAKACEQKPMDEAISNSVDAGVVYVASAGNAKINAQHRSPANNVDVITVSAIADYNGEPGGKAAATCEEAGPDDESASFSNYGTTIEVAAPGVCINSTVVGGGYEEFSGTSMAAPHVAGAAAILASMKNPENREEVKLIRQAIINAGKAGAFKDNSGDGVTEPLLYVGNEEIFDLNG